MAEYLYVLVSSGDSFGIYLVPADVNALEYAEKFQAADPTAEVRVITAAEAREIDAL